MSAAATAAALHSDHVNLLIFRYLQEAGFENTALALHSDWHRPADCYDPENLPFAREVQRNELVAVIQAGLFHDDLQSRVRKGDRKFRWTGIDARESIERHDDGLENGALRPSSSGKPKGRPPVSRRPQDFPTPAPKRQRRSEGSEAQVNGERDAMDMDAASGSGDAEDDGEAASPAIQSEPEQVDVIERYDSMDVATQTEIKTAPRTSTLYCKVDKPDAVVMQSMWNPGQSPNSAKILLTVGESLCRFYEVPSTNDGQELSYIDDTTIPDSVVVTACAWRPDGHGACYAVDGLRELPDGSQVASQQLIEHTMDGTSASFTCGHPLLEPPGMVLSLRHSPDSQYLLVARSNMKRGVVQIRKSRRSGQETSDEAIAWHMFDNPIDDAIWIADDTFIVCGENSLSAMYQVDASRKEDANGTSGGSAAMRGLISLNSKILDTSYKFDKLRYDRRHKLAVFISSESRKMIITPRLHDTDAKPEADVEVELPEDGVAFAFRPWEQPEDEAAAAADLEAPSLLAVGFGDGSCSIYSINHAPDTGAKCNELASLSLNEGPALAVAWSPNGEYLAAGNGDLVQIWSAESLRRKNGVRHVADAYITWRPKPETNGVLDGDHGEDKPLAEPSLSWSADGESLAFAAEKQIAVIRFTPSLNGEAQNVEMNGRLSP